MQCGTRGIPAVLAFLVLATMATAHAHKRPSEHYRAMSAILNDQGLSKEEKVAKLRAFLDKGVEPTSVVYWIARVDRASAQATAVELFRDPKGSRETKLKVGKVLLSHHCRKDDFVGEYAKFLVDAVLNGGEAEFMAKRELHRISAVGEYAFIASDFDGMSAKDFPKLRDRRVIPILIRCLDAPDHVYPQDQGDCIRGKPGESTGRNTQRQQIPVALARLAAAEAIPALKKTLFTHHDYYGRYNAAYALGLLMNLEASREVERFLRQNEKKDYNRSIFLAFGKGLLGRGDDRGIEFASIRHSFRFGKKNLSSALYMAAQHLAVVRGVRSPRAEGFYREILEYAPLRGLFLFDEASVIVPPQLRRVAPDRKSTVPVKTAAEALDYARERTIAVWKDVTDGIRANRLKGLSSHLTDIAKHTRDAEIRALSEAALEALAK